MNKIKEKYKLSLMIALYLFTICILYNFFKIFKVLHCLNIIQCISLIIPLLLYFKISKKNIKKSTIIVYLILVLITPFIFTKTYDLTVDGNSYHKTAIGLMSDGWNPIYESSNNFNSNTIGKLSELTRDNKSKIALWIDHYPKASYFIGTVIYSYTGNIESGKCITFLLDISLVLLLLSILEDKIGKTKAIIISILVGLNPIVLSQIFTYYVDGLMGILFGIELLLLSNTKIYEKKYDINFIYLLCCCGIFVNLKYTGLLYSGLIAAIYYFYYIIKNKQNRLEIFKNMTIKFSIIFIIAIGFIGYSSYIKNTLDHHNPLYPIIGKDKVDIITMMYPDNYDNMNSFERFINSIYSKTENLSRNNGNTTIKNPLKIYKSEIDSIALPDTRIGGFGPLFGAITTVSIIFICILIIKKIKKDKIIINENILLFTLSILLSIILVGESWWARYIPQFYYMIFIITYIFYNNIKNNKIRNILTYIILILLLINSSLFIYNRYKDIETFNKIKEDINYLSTNNNNELKLSTYDMFGYYYNLKDKNIKYIVNNKLKEKEIRYIYNWRIMLKL